MGARIKENMLLWFCTSGRGFSYASRPNSGPSGEGDREVAFMAHGAGSLPGDSLL